MKDYQSIDLSPWCNADPDWATAKRDGPNPSWPKAEDQIPHGELLLHGLPFQISSKAGEAHFLGFGEDAYREPLQIPIQATVRWIIFAHRLLVSRIDQGEPIGRTTAWYSFVYDDGEMIRTPIRERFEIGYIPEPWGQSTFLAVPDHADGLMPRYLGEWQRFGWRQTEAEAGWPRSFVLWAWSNPHPEKVLSSVRIEPGERAFLIGAVTVSNLDEQPFGRMARKPVHLTIEDPEVANRPFNLNVDVDRGIATYPYPLPPRSGEADYKAGLPGWGLPDHFRNHRSYVEIAALSSSTLRISDDKEIAAFNWKEVCDKQNLSTGAVSVELVDRGKNWVHVSVLDEDTGQPVACRVHFRTPEGIPYQPHGHHDHLLSDLPIWNIDVGGDVRLGHFTYAYIDGACQGWIPRGEVIIEVARGFEYEPISQVVNIEPHQRELTLHIKRRMNMAQERWFSGDTHVHFLSTMGALLEAQGEDLNVVNLLQSQWGHLFTNREDFIGRPVTSADQNTVVYTSQENRQHILGHLSLLGLKRPVMPWCSGGLDEAELAGTLETTLSYWADECHAQEGTVVIPHAPNPNCEIAALIATGRADALEFVDHKPYSHMEYYRYLNAGYRLPLVGGTDKMSAQVPVGLYRTYVYIPPDEEFSYENWCRQLRRGRTFLSGGPLLRFEVEGAMIGDTLHLQGNGGTLTVVAEAESIFPIHSLEILQGGRVVASAEDVKGAKRLHLETKLQINDHTWLAARVGGPGYHQALQHHDEWQRGIIAHSSPVYVAVGDEWNMEDRESQQYMLTLVHAGIEYIRHRSRQHTPGLVTHHHGEEDMQAYLERPFREAIKAIEDRLASEMNSEV